mgnify:CR=1 FL=1
MIEEKERTTALNVVNAALNKELMDSHYLLYKHGRGLDLGLDAISHLNNNNNDDNNNNNTNEHSTKNENDDINTDFDRIGTTGINSPGNNRKNNNVTDNNAPPRLPLQTSEAYLRQAAVAATTNATEALHESIRDQAFTATSAIRYVCGSIVSMYIDIFLPQYQRSRCCVLLLDA